MTQEYVEGVNVENCNKLLKWLDDGAPHAVFNMSISNKTLKLVVFEQGLDMDYPDPEFVSIVEQVNAKGIGDCGTVCCIAGAAAALAKGDIRAKVESNWTDLSNDAMTFLGLPKFETTNDSYMRHDLFDPELAPMNCTPEQAATALRRAMIGEEAWSEREDD